MQRRRPTKTAPKKATPATAGVGVRINKYLADQGIASRREADTLIERGLVLINGQKAFIGQKVGLKDTVAIKDGQALPDRVYLAYYKGRGIITHSPTATETDIASRLKTDYGLTDVYPVGRLDKDSEGLMILTNDGRVTGPLLSPDNGHEKEYEVEVDKPINGIILQKLERGVRIERYKTKPAKAVKHPKNRQRFTLTITEGKKHQIRRMCAAVGYQVQSLKRVRIMNITLGALKPNQYRKLQGAELKDFLKTLNIH